MDHIPVNIKNLVFEGGGVRGIAYAGALEVLEGLGLYDGVERAAGTSAGAITAGLLAMGFTGEEIAKTVMALDMRKFEDHWDPFRIVTEYGLYEGDAFLTWLQQQLAVKGLPEDITFKQFYGRSTTRDLRVFATDLDAHSVQEFSFRETPDAFVAEAIRASMSIPLFFKAWRFSNHRPNDHIYVDGGVVLNYPINAFDNEEGLTDHTLGFHLDNFRLRPQEPSFGYDHIIKYTKHLFDTLLEAQVIDFENDPDAIRHSVRINDFGISATDFDITEQQKEELINSGREATQHHFQTLKRRERADQTFK